VLGFEALIRCRDEHGQTIEPDVFIPIAEETGLIATIDNWVLHEACLACRRWNESRHETLSVSVNLSARQFHSNDLEQWISRVVGRIAQPEDIGETYVYLAKNGFTTGTTVIIDGGAHLV
jgi:EAL domain-containing protein (putative c-di-GMP-specific phosphodiesterase class I)